eukprot:jgi/Hompol1/3501/HPOL_006627-RA
MLTVCAVSTRLTPMLAPMLALALILLGLFVTPLAASPTPANLAQVPLQLDALRHITDDASATTPTSAVHQHSHDHAKRDVSTASEFVTVIGLTASHVTGAMHSMCAGGLVISIIKNGRPDNRIDVVLMGDGYTLAEQDQFEADIKRLVNDMWSASTFAPVLPLFNIWGFFRPSVDHGIGVGGVPKDTAFGLYRDGTELRGIYAAKADAARRVCADLGRFACDYPSLIGNDDFYGGLGGEFVIGTRSETTGTIVLRH